MAEQTTTETPDVPEPQDAPEQPPKGEQIVFKTQADLQAHIDRVLKDRLAREEKKREKAEQEAERRAREAAAKEQDDFKTLAEQYAARISELEPVQSKFEAAEEALARYQAALGAQLEAARKDLPVHIIALLDRMDAVDQLDYLAKHRDALVPSRPNGVPPTPTPDRQPPADPARDYITQTYRRVKRS